MLTRRLALPLAGALPALAMLAIPHGAARAAFPAYNGDTPDIAYDSGGSVRSTAGSFTPVAGTDPVWSPDGTKLAFVAGGSVVVAPVSNLSSTTTIGTGSEPTWSPDGAKIAFRGSDDEIYSRASDGSGSATNLTNSAAVDKEPAWSPDGSRIAFARQLGGATGKFQLYSMNASDGSGQTQLVSSSANDVHPSYAPDGSTIAFQSDRDGTDQIYTVPAGGGSVTRVTTSSSAAATQPAYSPEGDEIAIVRSGGIFRLTVATGAETSTGASGNNPDWRPFPPKNTGAPSVSYSGLLQVGRTVTADVGTWRGSPTAFTYQWQSCVSGSCTDIAGATGSSYTLTNADGGKNIRVGVSAQNAAGASPLVYSAEVAFVQSGFPLILTLPQITVGFGSLEGAPTIGFSVFGSTGTWQGATSFKFQWRRCEPNGGPCSDILGATSQTFFVTGDLVGRELVFAVTAHNDVGDTYIESNRSLRVTGLGPHSTATPPITGTNEVGQTLSVTAGSWTSTGGRAPTSITWEWRRCDAFGNLPSCVPIPGATNTVRSSFGTSSYTLTEADLDKTIRVYITGRNSVGSETIITNHTFPTLPKRRFIPSATTPPSIDGEPHPGQKLTVDLGAWSGDTPITYAVFWRRCDAIAAACKTLRTGGRQSYMLTRADLGHTLMVVVNATNGAGTSQAMTVPVGPVSLLPKPRKGRRIVGTNRADYIGGSAYDDTLLGRRGNDTIRGGNGRDRVDGGAGADVLDGGQGADRIFGGKGSDTINAADGETSSNKDFVDCGKGSDRVFVDANDVVKNCEVVSAAPPVR